MSRQTIEAHIPIVEVTLMEDRAHVVRRGPVQLPGGQARLRVNQVAPVLSDKTLSATLAENAKASVVDVQILREWVTLDTDKPRHPISSE